MRARLLYAVVPSAWRPAHRSRHELVAKVHPFASPGREQSGGFMLLTLEEETDPAFPFLGVHFPAEGSLCTGKGYVSMEVRDRAGPGASGQVSRLGPSALCPLASSSMNKCPWIPLGSQAGRCCGQKKFPALVLKRQLLSF